VILLEKFEPISEKYQLSRGEVGRPIIRAVCTIVAEVCRSRSTEVDSGRS